MEISKGTVFQSTPLLEYPKDVKRFLFSEFFIEYPDSDIIVQGLAECTPPRHFASNVFLKVIGYRYQRKLAALCNRQIFWPKGKKYILNTMK